MKSERIWIAKPSKEKRPHPKEIVRLLRECDRSEIFYTLSESRVVIGDWRKKFHRAEACSRTNTCP